MMPNLSTAWLWIRRNYGLWQPRRKAGRKKKEAETEIGRCCGHQAKVVMGRSAACVLSLHQSRGIFSRSLASIYHYLEITFVCLKFAGPETLLQYWILNAFSHDDDKNTWMRGERDPVVIFLLSLSLSLAGPPESKWRVLTRLIAVGSWENAIHRLGSWEWWIVFFQSTPIGISDSDWVSAAFDRPTARERVNEKQKTISPLLSPKYLCLCV